ncbi:MAG: ribonuclease D [Alphaproteobacteria bacterium]|nr:ribonuclease D [Alphaproteobacteria bacterium]
MNLIDTTKELKSVCEILQTQTHIAIDSEFIREKTYYPIPCLIQVACQKGAFLIDPLAEDLDLSPFFAVLQNENILKIFHSGRQDLEILYNLSGSVPVSVFDTQIAAEACGLGENVSYENLVKACCEVELDKTCRLTNWQLRPLTEEQMQYALGDVTHLLTCYAKIADYLKEHKRENWIAEEMVDLTDVAHYQVCPENAWQRIRHNGHSHAFLNALKALACWREKRAVKQNTTRQNIIKDEMLINIAAAFPKDMEEIKRVRGMRSDIAKSVLAKEMVEILSNLNESDFDKNLSKTDREKEVTLSPTQQSLYEILKLLLKIKSNEHGVVPHLITTEKKLREYVKSPKAKSKIMEGWRYEIFGRFAEMLRRGALGLTYNPSTHNIEIKTLEPHKKTPKLG